MHPLTAVQPSTLNPKPRKKTHRVLFTKKLLDELTFDPKAGKGWQWHYDERTPGLAVGISANGIKSFYLIRKVKGKATRIGLGRFPTVSIETARREAGDKNQLIAQKKNPRGEEGDGLLFSKFFERYMNEYARKKNKTAEAKMVSYKRYLATDRYGCNLEKLRMDEIDDDVINRIFDGVSKHAPVHANRVLALLRSIFNKAIKWKVWTTLNPCNAIEKNEETSRERSVTKTEMPYLLKALELEKNEMLRDVVRTALFTGARKSNVVSMRYEEINFDDLVWKIPETKTKNGIVYDIPLIPQMISLLRERQRDVGTEWVFPSEGKTGHYVEPKKGWKILLVRATALRLVEKLTTHYAWNEVEFERAKRYVLSAPSDALETYEKEAEKVGVWLKPLDMRDIRLHDLRRTLGSWQAGANVSEKIIGKSLGHLSQQSTKVYARVPLSAVRDAMMLATTNMLTSSSTETA